ncbi:PhoH-like protein [Synechococcus phage S-CBWM1]|uniref:PhoH-like protein n=1 Tax=Synechococcus phage S-CBWM1 TaxID=2053653 RepID=A0A3G1L3N6_9CAUD|nr:PhoH-like protein [Synechococcus phage S-CBWM1]ATW62789.1 PhoH-like protein [Synechococcus phage S-CBWM1]
MDGGDFQCELEDKIPITPDLFIIMALKSREKRRVRRQAEETFERLYQASNRNDILPFLPKNKRQSELWEALNRNTVTIAIGPSGVGKTLIALWWGLTEMSKGNLQKIYYVRSDVGCAHQRGRGALPGTMEEKMTPLIGPVYDNLAVMMRSSGAAEYLIQKKIIEPMMLEDVRGRSFNDCLIIFDEAQNALPENVKTVISRVGQDSKVVVTGDTRQIDLDVFRRENGLLDSYNRLAGLPSVGRVQFLREDIVRNGVIAAILEAYEV